MGKPIAARARLLAGASTTPSGQATLTMVTRVARRTALAAAAAAMSFAVATEALAQQSECYSAQVRGSARWDDISQSTRLVLDDPNASVAMLEAAIADCRTILRNTRNSSVPALLCVSRAQIELASRPELQSSQFERLNEARCNAYRASRLRGVNAARRDEANAVRADALIGLISANPGNANNYRQELVSSAHNASAPYNPNGPTAVHAAIAEMWVREGDVNEARAEAQRHLRGRELALALVRVARAQREQRPNDLAAVRQTLESADAACREWRRAQVCDSVAVNAELGGVYFELGETDRARGLLQAAISGTPASEEERASLPDAYYYLSVAQARLGDYNNAALNAGLAGPRQQRYLRQHCLMQLMKGPETVAELDNRGRWVPGSSAESRPAYLACRLGTDPEAELVMGMFWLRRAQVVATSSSTGTAAGTASGAAFSDAARSARGAFQRGRAALTAMGNDARRRTLGWPGHNAVTLEDVLVYADGVAGYYESRCDPRVTVPSGASEAAQIFEFYKLFSSSGSNRCLPR